MKNILKQFKSFLIWFGLICGALFFLYLFFISVAGPVKGTVVEEATGKPIEGAIVVASWSIAENALFGAINVGQVHVQEVLTDKDGQFSFKPWIDYVPWGYSVNDTNPQVLVAKPGYVPMWIGKERSSRQEVGQVIEDQGNERLNFMMAPPREGKSASSFALGATSLGQLKPYYKSSDMVIAEDTPRMKQYREDYADTGIKRAIN